MWKANKQTTCEIETQTYIHIKGGGDQNRSITCGTNIENKSRNLIYGFWAGSCIHMNKPAYA